MFKILIVTALITSGIASRYDPGVFTRVVLSRSRWQTLPDSGFDGYIALLDCSRVGDIVMVCFHNGKCKPMLVADCAGIADGGAAWMINGGYAGEVDYRTAIEEGCVGKRITIYETAPTRGQPTCEARSICYR
jgi:hypothetical protein